jgi:chromosome segregation ATPase
MMQRLTALPKDPEARASAIHEAAAWFVKNVVAPREAKLAELRQEHDNLEQRRDELEKQLADQAPLTTRH